MYTIMDRGRTHASIPEREGNETAAGLNTIKLTALELGHKHSDI